MPRGEQGKGDEVPGAGGACSGFMQPGTGHNGVLHGQERETHTQTCTALDWEIILAQLVMVGKGIQILMLE